MKKYKLKDILIPILSFVGIFLLAIYLFVAISDSLNNFDKVSKYSDNINIYEQNITKLNALSDTDLQNKETAYDNQIPVGGNIATLVNDTFNLANSYGLTAQRSDSSTKDTKNKNSKDEIKSISIDDLQSGDLENIPDSILINGLVYPVNLGMTVKGKKENILSFVDGLSKQERILNVISQNLTHSDVGDDSWTAKLTIYAYSVVETKPDLRRVKKITDPTDPQLAQPAKKVKISL